VGSSEWWAICLRCPTDTSSWWGGVVKVVRPLLLVGVMMVAACGTSQPPASTWPEGEYWTGTRSEYAVAMYECLKDRGFDVDLVEGSFGVLETPTNAGLAEYESCMQTVPPVYWPTTEDDFREVYSKWVDLYDCMVDAGYEMSEGIPSFESFWDRITNADAEGGVLAGNSPSDLVLGGNDARRFAFFECHPDPEEFW
jgi:hypothetical protein